jgi:hypothetical protein
VCKDSQFFYAPQQTFQSKIDEASALEKKEASENADSLRRERQKEAAKAKTTTTAPAPAVTALTTALNPGAPVVDALTTIEARQLQGHDQSTRRGDSQDDYSIGN